MQCPYCGKSNSGNAKRCSYCKKSLRSVLPQRTSVAPRYNYKLYVQRAIRILVTLIVICVTISVFGIGSYKVYYWAKAWWHGRLLANGETELPSVEEVTMDNGMVAHAATFFGNDGDSIFIEEMNRSYPIIGGVTRIEIPDSSWFDVSPEDSDAADITFTPILVTENNDKQPLDSLSFTVETPYSPLTLIHPKESRTSVNTSLFQIQIQVVYGSQVYVGGKNATNDVDSEGKLTVNVNVYAQGDNVISILVQTDNHKETRKDIILYRAVQEINLEYNESTPSTSSRNTLTISGKIEPGAELVVDSLHDPDSIKLDMAAGTFSFTAKFDRIGDNVITFRAKKDGKNDSVINHTIYYVPSISEYSRSAWKMDYSQLSYMTEQWKGRVFLCEGVIVDVFTGENQIVIMDVGTGGEKQYIALENYSSVGVPSIGMTYRTYADVNEQYFYVDKYIPKLSARYMSVVTAE